MKLSDFVFRLSSDKANGCKSIEDSFNKYILGQFICNCKKQILNTCLRFSNIMSLITPQIYDELHVYLIYMI